MSTDLSTHPSSCRKTHPHQKGKDIICPVCAERLSRNIEAKYHLLLHPQLVDDWEKCFRWCKCGFYTIQQVNLNSHMKTHQLDTTRHGPVPQLEDSENGILPLPSVHDIIPPRASSDGLPDVSLGPSLTTLTTVDDASMPIARHYPRAFDSPSYHVPSFSSIPQVGISTHSVPSPWYPAPIPLGPEYPNTFYETQAMPQLEGHSRFSLSPRVRTMGIIAEDMYCGLPSQSQSNATLALGRPTFGCDHSPLVFGDQSQHAFDQAVIHGNGADNNEIFVPYYPNSSIPPAQAYEILQAASPRGTIISDPQDPWATLRHPGHGSL